LVNGLIPYSHENVYTHKPCLWQVSELAIHTADPNNTVEIKPNCANVSY